MLAVALAQRVQHFAAKHQAKVIEMKLGKEEILR